MTVSLIHICVAWSLSCGDIVVPAQPDRFLVLDPGHLVVYCSVLHILGHLESDARFTLRSLKDNNLRHSSAPLRTSTDAMVEVRL